MLVRTVVTILSLLTFSFAYAQDVPSREERLAQANRFFLQKEYGKALPIYEIVRQYNNPLFDYKMGVCYIHSPNNKLDAIPYLERARDSKDPRIPKDVYLYLGKLYHFTYRFREAVKMLNEFKESEGISPESNRAADRIIAFCQNGKPLLGRRSPNISLKFMGFPINTSYNDFASLVSNDGKTMAMTSDRLKSSYNLVYDDQYVYLPEHLIKPTSDIFISSLIKEDDWSTPKAGEVDGASVLTLSISDNAQKLWYYGEQTEGNIGINMLERSKNGNWKKSQSIAIDFLNEYPVKGACFTSNGKVLYFSSKRPEGFGGYDIYWSHQIGKNRWAIPKNLGPAINTPFDEVNPFVPADSRTLYFSSDGHDSMGYLDIFRSKKQGANWADAINLGYPINSSYNDDHFIISTNQDHIYLSSDRNEEGAFGQYDILRVFLKKEDVQVTRVDGTIKVVDNGKSIPVHLYVEEVMSGAEQQYVFNPPPETGEHFMLLFPNRTYRIKVIYDENLTTTEDGWIARYDSLTKQASLGNEKKSSIELTITIPDSAYHYHLDILAKRESIQVFDKKIAERLSVEDSFHVYKANEQVSEEEAINTRYEGMIKLMSHIINYKDTTSLLTFDQILDESPFAFREKDDFNQVMEYLVARMNEAVDSTDIQMIFDLKTPVKQADRDKLQLNVAAVPDQFGRKIYHTGEIRYERNKIEFDDTFLQDIDALASLLNAKPKLKIAFTHIRGSVKESKFIEDKRLEKLSLYLSAKGVISNQLQFYYNESQDPSHPEKAVATSLSIIKVVIYEEQ